MGEPLATGFHDQEDTKKADEDGDKTPPTDGFAQKQSRGEGHGQRQGLQDRADVGERHIVKRGDEEPGRHSFGGGSEGDKAPIAAREIEAKVAEVAADDNKKGRRPYPAQEQRLKQRKIIRKALHAGVVQSERGHRDDHEQCAAQVVGKVLHARSLPAPPSRHQWDSSNK